MSFSSHIFCEIIPYAPKIRFFIFKIIAFVLFLTYNYYEIKLYYIWYSVNRIPYTR